MLHDAMTSYREALRHWVPLVSLHLFVRLVTLAILVPLIGALLAFTLSFSDQSALTDQDIAEFLLTPMGAFGALVVGSFVIASAMVDVAVMTSALRVRSTGILQPLGAALGFLSKALPRLIVFGGHFVVRVLMIALPFAAVTAIAAAYLLREYDINFYLTNRPPAFLLAVGIGGICGVALALLLLERLTAWAVAMHYCLFDLEAPGRSFALSRAKMEGHRVAFLGRLLAWFLIRLAVASLLATVAGFLLAEGPQLFASRLSLVFVVTIALLLVWSILNAGVSAISNGALADLLNEEFNRCLEARPARLDVDGPRALSRYLAAPIIAVVLAVGSLTISGALSNRFGGMEDVQVIGHRGAAASRPENTMAAVLKAVEDGADWVEIDVQETADGEVIVVHDSDFMKSAGVPTKIWDVTMEEVAEIDIGSWFDPAYADQRALLLRDVLAAVKDRSNLLIELKYYGHDVDLENRVIALVEAVGMQDQIATMSLKYPAVQKMRQLRPGWRTGVLAATAVGNLAGLEGDFLAVSMGRVTPALIAAADAAGKDVYAWTVNDPVSMSRMISVGVDGLITDEPALAREVLGHYETLSTPERLLLRLGDTIGLTFDVTPEGNEI
ncbi:MAG: glycerophosphodiester phosphodiesterase family protein [Pseudomonadota bacterium]